VLRLEVGWELDILSSLCYGAKCKDHKLDTAKYAAYDATSIADVAQ